VVSHSWLVIFFSLGKNFISNLGLFIAENKVTILSNMEHINSTQNYQPDNFLLACPGFIPLLYFQSIPKE
jgi:hypothetical protein